MLIQINGLAATFREVREFVAAKRRRKEKIRIKAKGAARAMITVRDARHFGSVRQFCRMSHWFGGAAERLDAVERQLISERGVPFPVPEQMLQDEDSSVSCFWGGLSLRCHADGLVTLIGGAAGLPSRAVTREFLDALALKCRIQGAS